MKRYSSWLQKNKLKIENGKLKMNVFFKSRFEKLRNFHFSIFNSQFTHSACPA